MLTFKRDNVFKNVTRFVKTLIEVRAPVLAAQVDENHAASGEPERVAPAEAAGSASAEAETRSMLMLRCSDLTPRIEIDALPWLVAALQAELEARAVPLIKKGAEPKKGDRWWDFTNSLWRARCYDAEGEEHTRSQCVRRRLRGDLTGLIFEEAKARVYAEMVQWRDELPGGVSASKS
jgi:hypothetical protein